jgi:NAD-dependent SIR2 family protein deacetylase
MLFGEFVGSTVAQQRYWARSYLGWRQIGTASPNAGHQALAALQDHGLTGLITQNVDGLHPLAGSRDVVELHGQISAVICLDCGDRTARADVQRRLRDLNPDLVQTPLLEHAELRPDGDAVVTDWHDFVLADCLVCGGRLKPDVVFFGESVPKPRVERCYAMVDAAEVLVVAGSSLTVMSGLRFVRHHFKRDRPVVIINRGATRGDEFATVKLDQGCSETLTALVADLAA